MVWLVWFFILFGYFGFSQPLSYLGWKYKLHIFLEAEICHLGSNQKNKINQAVFGWFSLVDFWFCLVGLVFLNITAVLGGNSTYKKTKIVHAISTHKGKIIQEVLDLVGIGLTKNNLGCSELNLALIVRLTLSQPILVKPFIRSSSRLTVSALG